LPVAAARPISLTASQRHRLKKMAYGHKTPYQARIRAHIVLHAARGRSNARIARQTGLHVDTVRTWRGRFAEEGMSGLADRRRCGRPPSFTALQSAQVKALACQLPAKTGTGPDVVQRPQHVGFERPQSVGISRLADVLKWPRGMACVGTT
jgi:transposase